MNFWRCFMSRKDIDIHDVNDLDLCMYECMYVYRSDVVQPSTRKNIN